MTTMSQVCASANPHALGGAVKGKRPLAARGQHAPMTDPFHCFKTSPEIIRLAVVMCVRFPLSLRKVEGPLHQRGKDIS